MLAPVAESFLRFSSDLARTVVRSDDVLSLAAVGGSFLRRLGTRLRQVILIFGQTCDRLVLVQLQSILSILESMDDWILQAGIAIMFVYNLTPDI